MSVSERSPKEVWTGIEPGDIGFDQGGGLVGFLIRHFSHSPYAHCWVYHTRNADGSWTTAEAYPGGLKTRNRDNAKVHRVVRVWRNDDERLDLLGKSQTLIGSKYNYRELFRIIHYRLRANFGAYLVVLMLLVVWAGWNGSLTSKVIAGVFATLTLYAAIPLSAKLNPEAVICSNHVAQSVLAARPDTILTYEPQAIWPGRLERDLNVQTWNDWTRSAGGGRSAHD